MLANPAYQQAFEYVPCCLPDRQRFIIDDDDDEDNDDAQSDLVRLVLNLSFLTEQQAKSFNFDKDSYSDARKAIDVVRSMKLSLQEKFEAIN